MNVKLREEVARIAGGDFIEQEVKQVSVPNGESFFIVRYLKKDDEGALHSCAINTKKIE